MFVFRVRPVQYSLMVVCLSVKYICKNMFGLFLFLGGLKNPRLRTRPIGWVQCMSQIDGIVGPVESEVFWPLQEGQREPVLLVISVFS